MQTRLKSFFFLVFSVRRSKWEKSDVRWDRKWVMLHVPCSRDTITGWRPTVLLGRCEIGEAWRCLWELLRWLGQLFIEGGQRLTFPAGDLEWLASEICIGGRKLVTFDIRDARSWMAGVRFVYGRTEMGITSWSLWDVLSDCRLTLCVVGLIWITLNVKWVTSCVLRGRLSMWSLKWITLNVKWVTSCALHGRL